MASSSTSISSESSESSESSSSSSEIRGTILSFLTEGVVWSKSKFLSSEMGAISSGLVKNRLAQTVGVNSVTYKIGNVSLFLRERQGDSAENIKLTVDVYEADANGNPLTSIASIAKSSSDITWTGWHNFDFRLEERTAPLSRLISIVVRQEGGDEDNYIPWMYASGSLPGASALYSSDGGITWVEHHDIIRLVKVSKSYNPFSALCDSGVLQSSIAEQVFVNFKNFDVPSQDGGADYSGNHHGTSTLPEDPERLVISNKNLITSIVVDNSGSMGWNDRGKNKVVAAGEIVSQIKAKYPGSTVFDFIKFGAFGLGTPISGGGATYTSIQLDPHNPDVVTLNNDGTTPTLEDGIIASGFSNLELNHTYVFQSVKSGEIQLFNGTGTIDQNLGIRVTENVQNIGPESLPIILSVQTLGTGSESGAEGTPSTIAEVPNVGSTQIRKPTVTGRILNISSLSSDLLVETNRARISNPSLFEIGETIDIVDTDGISCSHVINSIGDSFIDFAPYVPVGFGDGSSSSGGLIQQTSVYNVIYVDPNEMIDLLVKDSQASAPVTFYIQTPNGGKLSWNFTAMKEWNVLYFTYIDRPFNLVTFITDEDGKPLPSHTKIRYFIDEQPSWDALSKIITINFDEPITIEQGSDVIPLPSISGINFGDSITLLSETGAEFRGYVVMEINDLDISIRILPPVMQDTFQLVGIKVESSPKIDPSGQRVDMAFCGVDISSIKAGRLGQNRLPNDPLQIDPSETDMNKYNEDRTYWLNGSFDIPTVSSLDNNGGVGYAALRLLPVTEDKLNTIQEDEEKVSRIFSNSYLTDDELAKLSALEYEYSQMVENQPDEVTIFPEEDPVPPSENIEGTGDWILSPQYALVGQATKFTSLATEMELLNITGKSLKFDMTSIDGEVAFLLAKEHIVYPTVNIMDDSDKILTRYLLESYPVYFASPVQIFSRPEPGKTVVFEIKLEDTFVEIPVPGVFAAGGESIRLDYVIYNRGGYVDGSTMRVKIYDAFRTKTEVQFDPWSTTPNLTSELSTDVKFIDQLFHRLERDTNGSYVADIDMPSDYAEAVYLDGYEEGGFSVEVVNGRASFTIPAIDVVTRLIIKTEMICPDNTTVSCTRIDSVWIKNPISLEIQLPSKATSGFEEPPFEGVVIMKCFDEIVPNNILISLRGSIHGKYNAGDNDKIDPTSEVGGALESIANLAGYGAADDNLLVQGSWPATPVKPSIGKTNNGRSSGYMVGPHGPVLMHPKKDSEDNELEGDKEWFSAFASYQPPKARGPFETIENKEIEWVSAQEDINEIYINSSIWRRGEFIGKAANCYADGWDSVVVLVDAAASKNRFFNYFDEQWLIDDILGFSRSTGVARPVVFSASGAIKTRLPGRLEIFYPTRPIDQETGNLLGETDQLVEFGMESKGWAGIQIGKCGFVPPPNEDNEAEKCMEPWCTQVSVFSKCSKPNGTTLNLRGCASDDYSSCTNVDILGNKTYSDPQITWMEPLTVTFWLNGVVIQNPFNVIRDGTTQSEVWVEVKFSGESLPLVARRHDIRNTAGVPISMPMANLDICYLQQTWDDAGTLMSSQEFRDGTLSLTEYNPVVSICRTTASESHYHSCSVDDVTGNGITTGTFSEGGITLIEDHIHSVANFVVSNSPDENGIIHSHSPLSVAVTKLNPITNNILNICLKAKASYDASKTPMFREVETTQCTQLEWFDVWEMNVGFDDYGWAQTDVLKNNDGLTVWANLKHKVDGLYVPVDDGIRVSFNVKAVGNKTGIDDNIPTFDMTVTAYKLYMGIIVSATAYADGKVLTKTENTVYRSILQWSPSVNLLVDEPTNDDVYIANALDNIGEVKGASMLYDAIILASDRINIYKADNPEWNTADQAIFILTDGCENLSERTINQVVSRIKMLTNDDRPAFVAMILFGSPSQADVFLANKLQRDTGGILVRVPIGYDPLLIPDMISSLFKIGADSFNGGSYVGVIDIGGSGTNSDGQSGLCKQICMNVDTPTGSTVTLSIRFSNDEDDWTEWSEIQTLVSPITCLDFNDKFRYMQYMVRMNGNSDFESPVVSNLNMTYLRPSTDVVFMQPISVNVNADEFVSETIITHAASIPEGGSLKYGSVNNNTTQESDYGYTEKPWFNANERSIILTRMNEPTYQINSKTYKALNGAWPDNTSVGVYILHEGEIDGEIADNTSYILNNKNGTISFMSSLEEGSRVILDIKPEEMVRVAIKMENYATTPIKIDHMTVLFNKTKRFNRYSDGMIKRHSTGDDLNESSSSSESSFS
jgi:hypothetical protein